MKKVFHIPTLLLHGLMLLIVTMTLPHYPDALLISALIWLICYFVYAFRLVLKEHAPLPLFLSHVIGCLVQGIVLNQPRLLYNGLGAGLAHFFYLTALAVSPFLLALLLFVAYALKKNQHNNGKQATRLGWPEIVIL